MLKNLIERLCHPGLNSSERHGCDLCRCVCVCVCARARARVRACVRACVCVCVYVCVCVCLGGVMSLFHISHQCMHACMNDYRRVSNQLKLQQDSSASDNDHNVNVLATVKRRQRDCRSWNDPCVPWSSDADESCCNSRRFVCRCNLWMQNCRCVSRAWGK